MGMTATLFNDAKPFEEIVNTLSTNKKTYVKSGKNCSNNFRGEEI